MQNAGFLRNAIILGLITAIGPFGIDMYLPALPDIGASLAVTPDAVILSLTSFFVAFGLFQIVFGTISDVYGRIWPLYIGIGLFVIAGVGCAMAQDIETLVALRFLQGIGGAAGIIIPRAIVRDLYSGLTEVRMMALLMLVFSVSPLLAPLAGSFVVEWAGWRGVFWSITGLGLAGVVMLAVFVRETLPPERRIKSDIPTLIAAWRKLLTDRAFMGMTFIGACAITAFFIYLGNSAFVLNTHYGLSPRAYSIAFSVNAAAFFAAAQMNEHMGRRYGMTRILLPAAIGFATTLTLLAVLFAFGVDNFWVMAVMLFIGFGFVGFIMPTITVLALEDHGDMAGTAASLMNTMQLLIGAGAIAVSGALGDGSPFPMLAGIAAAAILTLFFTYTTFYRRPA